jgi:hypothetical protein
MDLKNLIPYGSDIIEKLTDTHRDIYRLQKLGKTVTAVENDAVETWGDSKVVNVVLVNNVPTVMKSSYDNLTGKKIFHPIPYDNQNMIKNEISVRKSRLKQEKNMIEKLLPYIGIIGAFLFVTAVVYLMVEMNTSHDKEVTKRTEIQMEREVEIAEINREALREFSTAMKDIAKENNMATANLTRRIGELDAVFTQIINSS